MDSWCRPTPRCTTRRRPDAERATIEARHRKCQDRIAKLAGQISADRQLVVRLRQWSTDYPPGTLVRLLDERAATESALREAEAAVIEYRAELVEAKAAETKHLEIIPLLRKQENKLAGRARILADLAARVVYIAQWNAAATEAAWRADDQAAEAKSTARTLRAQAEESVRLADDHRRRWRSCGLVVRTRWPGRTPGAATVSEMLTLHRRRLVAIQTLAVHAATLA